MRRAAPLAMLAAVLLTAPGPVSAHPGGLDTGGCHTNRKTGDYHCHGKPRAAAKAPARAPPANGGSLHFRNCTEASAAGHRRIRQGEPGYRAGLDRDGDGIACE